MAREVHEREDLLRDAKALLPRAQLQVNFDNQTEEVFVGFRAGGALSLYFGSDPVYHFNSQNQLRRAFVQNQIVKAEHGRLATWQPRRTDNAVEMLRHDMHLDEQGRFGKRLTERLHALQQAILNKHYAVTGQVPHDEDVVGKLIEWIEQFQEVIVAQSPRVG